MSWNLMFNIIKHFKNKELFVALYFLLFIVGFSIYSFNFYNELRVLEVFLLIGLGLYSLIHKKSYFSKYEFCFLIFILIGFLFWSNYSYIFYELILFYLLFFLFFFLSPSLPLFLSVLNKKSE